VKRSQDLRNSAGLCAGHVTRVASSFLENDLDRPGQTNLHLKTQVEQVKSPQTFSSCPETRIGNKSLLNRVA